MIELSEEEIINIVKEIKNHQIAVFEPKENIQITRNYFTEKQRNAIQGLLDLYQKEKAKNNELEKYKIHLTDEQYRRVIDIAQKDIIKDYISKDKIKEKIEELENLKLCSDNFYKLITEDKIKLLQELLEERN